MNNKLLLSAGLSVLSLAVSAKPNVIMILADDMGFENLSCYGSDYRTPNLDKLASTGVRFTQCFSTPLSSPSRTQLITGKYNFRNYVGWGAMQPEEKTFGNIAKEAGYVTACAGKWQMSRSLSLPAKEGFDEYFLWWHTEQGSRYAKPIIDHNGQRRPTTLDDYGPALISDYVMDFIDRNKEKPFFLYYPMVLIHSPHWPTPDSEQWSDLALRTKEDIAMHSDMMSYCDKMIGRLVAKLEAEGLMDNTVILFTGDNGTSSKIQVPFRGDLKRGGKASTKDAGIHVPFIAYWKGHTPAGKVNDDIIDFTDFYPTIADIMGVEATTNQTSPITSVLDGVSFYEQLNGRRGNPREWSFTHYEPLLNSTGIKRFTHNGDYKLYGNGTFFCVKNDPSESRDIAPGQGTKQEEAVRAMLQKALDSFPQTPEKPLLKGGAKDKK